MIGDFEVSMLALVVAAVANLIIGFLWYSPALFGNMWLRHSGMGPDMPKPQAKEMTRSITLSVVATLITTYVFSQLVAALGLATLAQGLLLAGFLWLAFQATILLSAVLWERKSWTFYAINASYWLVSLLVIALVVMLVR